MSGRCDGCGAVGPVVGDDCACWGKAVRTAEQEAVINAAVAFRTEQDRPMLLRAEARRRLEDAVDALLKAEPRWKS